jgi:hypothetical protein
VSFAGRKKGRRNCEFKLFSAWGLPFRSEWLSKRRDEIFRVSLGSDAALKSRGNFRIFVVVGVEGLAVL